MKDTELLLRELLAASSRLQECEHIARKSSRADVATEARVAGTIVAGMVSKLMAPNCARDTELLS